MKKNIILIFGLVLLGLTSACSLDPTLADRDSVDIPNENTMRQMIDGVYGQMVDYRFLGRNTIIAGEVRADNVFANSNSGRFVSMSSMNLLSTHADVAETFQYGYKSLANANIIINNDLASIEGSEANKFHILAEAYALRALIHFELLKLYGQQYISGGSNLGITYAKEFKGATIDIPRGTVSENEQDLYADINQAISYFSQAQNSEFSSSKLIMTLDAAYALKSRVGTYFKNYTVALEGSTPIVDKYSITPENDVVDYWAATTPGAASIFELARSGSENQGINSISHIYRGTSYGDIQVFDNLIADAGFEANDVRASTDMIDFEGTRLRNMGKYPSTGTELGTDNIKIFRIEEIVLNHAEALLNSNTAEALEYLNKIPQNRGASAYSAATLDNILAERRKELMFEGFRFHDLARHGLGIRDIDPTSLNNHGEIPAGDHRFAMPIPQRELDANSASVQNPGY